MDTLTDLLSCLADERLEKLLDFNSMYTEDVESLRRVLEYNKDDLRFAI